MNIISYAEAGNQDMGPPLLGIGLIVLALRLAPSGDIARREAQASKSVEPAYQGAAQSPTQRRGENTKPRDSASHAAGKSGQSDSNATSQGEPAIPRRIKEGSVSETHPGVSRQLPDNFELLDAKTAVGRAFPVSLVIERECI